MSMSVFNLHLKVDSKTFQLMLLKLWSICHKFFLNTLIQSGSNYFESVAFLQQMHDNVIKIGRKDGGRLVSQITSSLLNIESLSAEWWYTFIAAGLGWYARVWVSVKPCLPIYNRFKNGVGENFRINNVLQRVNKITSCRQRRASELNDVNVHGA